MEVEGVVRSRPEKDFNPVSDVFHIHALLVVCSDFMYSILFAGLHTFCHACTQKHTHVQARHTCTCTRTHTRTEWIAVGFVGLRE